MPRRGRLGPQAAGPTEKPPVGHAEETGPCRAADEDIGPYRTVLLAGVQKECPARGAGPTLVRISEVMNHKQNGVLRQNFLLILFF